MPKAPWTYQSRNVSSFQVAENYFGPRLCFFHLQKAKHQAGHLSGGSYGRRHRTGLLHYSCAHGQWAPELLPAPSVPAENVASGSKDMPQKSISLESIHCSPNICSLPGRSNPSLKYFPIEGTQSKSSSKLFARTQNSFAAALSSAASENWEKAERCWRKGHKLYWSYSNLIWLSRKKGRKKRTEKNKEPKSWHHAISVFWARRKRG